MYLQCTLGAIFTVFISCVHCNISVNYNEKNKVYVPSAPQNLTANRVSSDEVHLSWVPPTKFIVRESSFVQSDDAVQADSPLDKMMQVVPKAAPIDISPEYRNIMADSPSRAGEMERINLNEKQMSKRETRLRRKRRQDPTQTNTTETHQPFQLPPIEKKSHQHTAPHKDPTQVAYVLYYEQGVSALDSSTITGIPSMDDVKRKFFFPSEGMNDFKNTKNLTLLNNAGLLTKVVGFRLKNLKSFTAYKVWVRAFYRNFPLDGVRSSQLVDRLGPPSDALYILTDVRPPSAPIILNLTCEQDTDNLYLQWRQPMSFDNSIDQYVVTIRKIPEENPRTRLMLPANKSDIETTISVTLEFWNDTRYEVKIYAVTLSVAKPHMLINGSESPPHEVSSDSCIVYVEAHSPEQRQSESHVASVALLAALIIALMAAIVVIAFYWRCRSRLTKCISAAYSYLEEGGERAARAPLNSYKKPANVGPPLAPLAPLAPPRLRGSGVFSAGRYVAHVAGLHQDGDIGFSKEYEIVVSKSAALSHTSHHSHLPENRLKNRYLNITAYDHSRVCVSSGGCCSSAHVGCEYVNANFIDGMMDRLDENTVNRIKRKLDRRNQTEREPAPKPQKPQPILAEGIESAFLNIEFSGIVDEDEVDEDVSDQSDDDDELDDVYVDIDGVPTQVKLEWLLWRRRYIATQGPTPATLDSFWKMNWQHRVDTIVMITNLVERGRRKCDMYWPGGGLGSSVEYGGICVTLVHEETLAAYTVRRLTCRNRRAPGCIRSVVQFHYCVWPDHGTPRHPQLVLPFVRAANHARGTVLVHCSAGVGRTGTYIVLDAQLNQLALTGTLSPFGFLCRARTQRNHLVQTEEQYVFVHDALLEHVRSGITDIEFKKMRVYLVKLLQPITEEELAVLDLNTNKAKSVNDLSNGYEQAETQSVKSSQANDSLSAKGSQTSVGTIDLNEICSVKSISTKSPVQEVRESDMGEINGDISEELVNGDVPDGVYDLAPRTDTYSKKMQTYNNLSEAEKEEIRKANRVENYAILERMRSLSSRTQQFHGPPPVNILEKQVLLISRSVSGPCASSSLPVNGDKNGAGAALPTEEARVLLVPKPGQDGSEYINASWVSGRRRMREYCVSAHPRGDKGPLWRMLWDHTAQILLDLSHEDCEVFWPTEEEKELYVANFKASFVSKDIYVAHRKSSAKKENQTDVIEQNGLRRQESSECADDERLIPEHSPTNQSDSSYRFDQTELRLERLSTGSRDLSTRKSIANGDLFSSEKKNGPKSPKSPSKMSLKNFKLSSPTKFKFPDWSRAGSPPETAPPPPPIAPSLSIEEEIELRRPCYTFEKVDKVPDNIPSDRIIYVTNVSVHSLQDDYQLNVKFIKCLGWLEGETTSYTIGKPDENEYIRAVREASTDLERDQALEALTEPFKDSYALIEFVAGCQMEYKNGPVVVVDKNGSNPSLSFCCLSAACGARGCPLELSLSADVYCWNSLTAGTRTVRPAHDSLLRQYAAVHQYAKTHGQIYETESPSHQPSSESSASSSKSST